MAIAQQKTFCVLHFAKCEPVTTVQRHFRRQYPVFDLPTAQSISRWYKQFQDTGFLCKGKSDNACQTKSFGLTPQKSTRLAGREINISLIFVWRVLRRRLFLKPYRIQLLQALHTGLKDVWSFENSSFRMCHKKFFLNTLSV
ncbi:hypothetical protein AVEN_255585-1 [Araneus ventricosus]|uniref:DUF4817 domain-containing protein n=1 Tax=Araneus ventricosus TaxID=182803 RepID=A0A4Y2UT97_ARAVE|nr:hypothetical protein AVEN_255585-1 [Araneus ventricosus]